MWNMNKMIQHTMWYVMGKSVSERAPKTSPNVAFDFDKQKIHQWSAASSQEHSGGAKNGGEKRGRVGG